MFWMLLHIAGYVALATLLPSVATREVLKHRVKRKTLSAADRIQRIARLELQLGIGLDVGREWLLSRNIRCADYLRHLAEKGNGAVVHGCWGCDEQFRPQVHKDWYQAGVVDKDLRSRLCPSCYAGATGSITVADFTTAAKP